MSNSPPPTELTPTKGRGKCRGPWRFALLALAMPPLLGHAADPIDAVIAGIKPGEWRELPNTRMQDVFPRQEGHPAWGIMGPQAVTMAWGGAAYDTKRNVLVITGGGHGDYGGNEVYELSLKALKWRRATEPSRMVDLGGGKFKAAGSEAPVSSHTYDGLAYMANVDRVFKFGGSYYGNGSAYDLNAYLYDVGSRSWKRGAAAPTGALQVTSDYDAKTGRVIVGTSHGLMAYDPTSDSWQRSRLDAADLGASGGVVDPGRRLYVETTADLGKIVYYDADQLGDRKSATVQGDSDWGARPGMAYHPSSKRIVLWSGGREVWTLRTDTWVAGKFQNPNTAAPVELNISGTRKTSGIYGRWQYVPDYDVFIAYGHSTDNVWLYKLPPEQFHQVAKKEDCGADLCVGPGYRYGRPSEAALAAKDGQTIAIAAGDYDRDVAIWTQNNLTIRGTGGRAHLRAVGVSAEGKATWVIKGNNTTVENVEFSGAKVSDENGAGIRLEGAGLTVKNCYFHDNDTGILTGVNLNSDVLVEYSEFARSGAKYAHPHNIYIGTVRSFTLRYSYMHHARVGHNVKSRALRSYILYNRIMDEEDGSSSYAIDLPDGGVSYVIGNLIQQGPKTENYTIVAYGAEGLKNPANELYLVNNTIVNDGPPDGRFVFVKSGTAVAKIINNIFAGPGKLLDGPGKMSNNLVSDKSDLLNAAGFDYRLRLGSRAIDGGIEPGAASGFNLEPVSQYVHKARAEPRKREGAIDIGAYEYSAK